jgi:hypothetical protein
MKTTLQLLVGAGLLIPGLLLLLRHFKLAPPALEAITRFFVGGLRLGFFVPGMMTVVGALLVGSALGLGAPRDENLR